METYQVFKKEEKFEAVNMDKFTARDDVNEYLSNGFRSLGNVEASSIEKAIAVARVDLVELEESDSKEDAILTERSTSKFEVLVGKVTSYNAIASGQVQFELDSKKVVIELHLKDSWVLNHQDEVVVIGEMEQFTGKFRAHAYKNISKGVKGGGYVGGIFGWLLIILGLCLGLYILPLVLIPIGIRLIAKGKDFSRAYETFIGY
ncbi:hypothetical protein J4N45_04560 [Vibrio sp. SCSIO 43140]|uniref:hypothetical protein n=1 Tax=Vibrio sp. SCSIO 43140 TaxID=2819100 RepID=UPI002075AE67|nr:hypothetical protein [Vibrio sp. SCSIO 43140]USD61251.1 hypothetical protein J4N45_04560 [Vibrio sp. SCSIO 43140]